MSQTRRTIGGESNKRGNRYEDGFAVYRLIRLAPRVIHEGIVVRIKEQAGCPVDDLLILEANVHHYYQLKDDRQITWGAASGKLRREFLDQKTQCESGGEEATLTVVVSREDRRVSLVKHLPGELEGFVRVVHFPPVRRPSELTRRPDTREDLIRIIPWKVPGHAGLVDLACGFHLAWVESQPDSEGFGDLGAMIAWLRRQPAFQLVRPLPDPIHPLWIRFEEIVSAILGLSWCVDRGYFEWFYPPREAGHGEACDGENFRRFVDRVLDRVPTTFEEFEVLLP